MVDVLHDSLEIDPSFLQFVSLLFRGRLDILLNVRLEFIFELYFVEEVFATLLELVVFEEHVFLVIGLG